MDAVITAYQQDEIDGDTVMAIEKVLDFCIRFAADVGWMRNQTGSFSPKFPAIARRSPFSLNTRGELTLLFGQLETTPEEQHFAREWRAELETLFQADGKWPVRYPVLKPGVWVRRVEEFLDTLEWRVAGGGGSEGAL